MISLKSCIELAYAIERLPEPEINRIFQVFNLRFHITPPHAKTSKAEKVNILLDHASAVNVPGPFGNSFHVDLLQYVVTNYYRTKLAPNNSDGTVYRGMEKVKHEDLFSLDHQPLARSLRRDGYIVKEQLITKLLPSEIEEAKTESELFSLIDKLAFDTAKGHLRQAIDSHAEGNWASANSQFRPFIESILIDICSRLLPTNPCSSASMAIKLLAETASPPFFRADLNEVESKGCDKPFVEGLWKRLHPEGVHPGLSDEEDSTFRYHLTIVFAHYLLRRLEKREHTNKG